MQQYVAVCKRIRQYEVVERLSLISLSSSRMRFSRMSMSLSLSHTHTHTHTHTHQPTHTPTHNTPELLAHVLYALVTLEPCFLSVPMRP
jgi:hypothetical protein